MDGLTDRIVHRRCSRLLIPLLMHLPVTPNVVTLGGFILGLTAAWQFWYASPHSATLGLLLYVTAAVADHIDGDLARLTAKESRLGRWLDVCADTLTNVLIVLGMAATVSRVGGRLMPLLGGTAALGILLSSLLVNFFSPPTERSPRIGHVILRLGNRDAFYLVLVTFVVLLWKVPGLLPHLLWVLALGSHAYWMMCLGNRIAAHGVGEIKER